MNINFKMLLSACNFCGIKDVRMALHGVHVNNKHIAATDGNIMFIHKHEVESRLDVIIPFDAIKGATKLFGNKVETVTLCKLDDVTYSLTSGEAVYKFTSIYAKFPDIERVIPRHIDPESAMNNRLKLDLNYVSLINKVTKINKWNQPMMEFSGDNSCSPVIFKWANCENTQVLLMPLKY